MILRKKRKPSYIKYLVFLMLSISLVLFQQFYPLKSSRMFFNWYTTASVITRFTQKPAMSVKEAFFNASDYINTVEKNRSLQDENIKLKVLVKKAMFLATENKELRYLINMSKFMGKKTVPANIYLDSSNLYVNSVLINKGLNDGIQPGFAVLNQEGLVGRILECSRDFSRVLLMNDYNAAIPVRILESGVHGILKGRNNFNHVRLVTKERNDDVKKGQHVVSSSLHGIFDDGIPVGIIGNITNEEIEVIPYANLNRITKVLVIKR